MLILLKRIVFDPKFTIGFISINGRFECWTCEDAVREVEGKTVEQWKIKGETAIPYGEYNVIVNMSNRFKRMLPLLENVPGFEGIRIHPGNTAADTEGCILPGKNTLPNGVSESRKAFDPFYAQILNARHRSEKVSLRIVNAHWVERTR